MKTLVLIDANALIHRAFYALPPMVNKKGEPVNALYGLSSILLRLVREMKPDYIIAAFDLPTPTFRHKEFEAYKAQRKKSSPELIAQLKIAPHIFDGFGIKTLSQEGYEADDVIASLALKFGSEPHLNVVIVTGDMDTLQLVKGDKVVVCTMKKGIGETITYNEHEVKERFGIAPKELPDFKGLKGDPSDNIPGVPGVGEKTTIKLLQEFKTLENLYESIEKDKTLIDAKLYAKLIENKDQAFFSKYLATTRNDLPLPVELPDLVYSFEENMLRAFFESCGFRSLAARLMEQEEIPQQEELKKEDKGGGVDGVVFLNTSYNKELFLFLEEGSLYVANRENFCVIKDVSESSMLLSLYEKKPVLIGHDLKKIIAWHLRNKIILPHVEFDTMIAAWLLDPERKDYSLETLTEKIFKKEKYESGVLFHLYEWQKKKIAEHELERVLYNIEIPLIPILTAMEMRGIRLDTHELLELGKKVDKELEELQADIYKVSDSSFNISSPKQLSEVLFVLLKLPTKGIRKTPGGVLSTDASELTKLRDAHSIINFVLRYRELTKLKTTYIEALPKLVREETGRLHTTFNQTGTGTGRLSSSDPNLQNIPATGDEARMLRDAFIPEKGFQFFAFDYSQLELRIVASLSGDEKMVKAFLENQDIHALTAAEVHGLSLGQVTPEIRRQAKTLNFGIMYGMGPRAFAESSGLTLAEAKQFIKAYFENFSTIKAFQDSIVSFAKTYGYVKTETGRRRYLPDITSGNPKFQSQAERAAINMPTQGLAADIMKLAMIQVAQWIKENGYEDNVRLLLTIHDELVFEVRDGVGEGVIQEIKRCMENAFMLNVPLIVDVKTGTSWGGMKKI